MLYWGDTMGRIGYVDMQCKNKEYSNHVIQQTVRLRRGVDCRAVRSTTCTFWTMGSGCCTRLRTDYSRCCTLSRAWSEG